MGALRAYRLDTATSIDKQHLRALDTLDLNLLLVAGLERQRGDVFQLVLGHGSVRRNSEWSNETIGLLSGLQEEAGCDRKWGKSFTESHGRSRS